jgi:hypothetical protein
MRLFRLLLLLAALGLASCAGRERWPLFHDAQGGAQRARPAGEGRYTVKRPVLAEDLAFYLRYRTAAGTAETAADPAEPGEAGAAPGEAGGPAVELRVLDAAGGVLARRPLAGLSPAAELEVDLQVALPPGARVAGFSFAPAGGRLSEILEILEAGLAPPFEGFELADGRLRLGTGVSGLAHSPAGVEVELAHEPFADGGWCIEMDYELAAPEALEGQDGQDASEGGEGSAPRARARLEAASGSRRAAFQQEALPGARRWFLYPATIGFAPARLSLRPLDDGRAALRRLEVVPSPARARAQDGSAPDPLPAEPAVVLLYNPRQWRQPEYELFAWERFPGILILDTADYTVQDRFFKRLAFFVEKEGYRGRLLSDPEMRGKHGYNAHDYRAEDLARFFAAADAQGFPLNREEELLRAILKANGLLRGGTSGEDRVTGAGGASARAAATAGQGAVLSISRESSEILRALLLTHEAFHGLFFTLPRYREACQQAWRDLPDPERKFWRLFLDWGGYDSRDGYLAANEMQAYLFQQPREGLNGYFRLLTAERLERAYPEEAPWLRSFLAAGGGGFEAAFDRLAPALQREAGLEGGAVLEWSKARP